jgi:hypothetical protein
MPGDGDRPSPLEGADGLSHRAGAQRAGAARRRCRSRTRWSVDPAASLRSSTASSSPSLIEGASVSLGVTPLAAFDVPALLMTLDRYPYGCAEQTTSRALPLLYLSELSAASGIQDDREVHKRVQEAIYRVLNYQSSSGSFGLWSPGSGDLWLDAYVTDFLTRAREQKGSTCRNRRSCRRSTICRTRSATTSTSRRAATRSPMRSMFWRATSRASVGDLRYYADTKLEQFPARWPDRPTRREPCALRRPRAFRADLSAALPARLLECRTTTGTVPTTVRGCATAPRSWRSPPKAGRRAGVVPELDQARGRRARQRATWTLDAGRGLDAAGGARAQGSATTGHQARRQRDGHRAAPRPTREGAELLAKPDQGGQHLGGSGPGRGHHGRRPANRCRPAATASPSAHLLHAGRRGGQCQRGAAERALSSSCSRSSRRTTGSRACWSPISCRPASRSTIRAWSTAPSLGNFDWLPRDRGRASGVPRRPLRRRLRPRPATLSDMTLAYVVRAVTPGVFDASGGERRGHVSSRILAPARRRHDGGGAQ